ncbi:outer membrane protein [Cucumibacter marinus]|uniref:outer membrane protein n=1 Tax=Cucumibacter marinus TaxID=1121252 RepID=UPI00040AD30B|nr:outer membrane beta-barrel protein [Cucumibacter marinus]
MFNKTTLAVSAIAMLSMTGSALAADLYVAPEVPEVVEAVSGDWDGIYIGAFGGIGSGLADHVSGPATNDIDLSGTILGVTGGANFYLSDVIIGGLAVDFAWTNMTGTYTGGLTSTHTIDSQGAVRGVLGYDGGNIMPYVTGGIAFATATRTSTWGGPNNTATATHTGYTLGGGAQIKVSENLALDVQYRYTDLGEQVYEWSGGGTDPTIHLTDHTVTAGFNFFID